MDRSIAVFLIGSVIAIAELIKADERSPGMWALFTLVLPAFWAALVY